MQNSQCLCHYQSMALSPSTLQQRQLCLQGGLLIGIIVYLESVQDTLRYVSAASEKQHLGLASSPHAYQHAEEIITPSQWQKQFGLQQLFSLQREMGASTSMLICTFAAEQVSVGGRRA